MGAWQIRLALGVLAAAGWVTLWPASGISEEKPPAQTGADMPKADTPKADTPKADTPKADTPKADTPKADTPKADTPKADTPKADTPKTDTPKADAPKAETPEAEAPKAETPKADEATLARIEKQLLNIEDLLKGLQQEEAQASLAQVTAQGVAKGADIDEIRKQLASGSKKKVHLDYRAAMQGVAAQWLGLSEKYDRIIGITKPLERDRDRVTPSLQMRIDNLSKRASGKYRSALEKVVTCFTRCADYKNAVQAQLVIYQMTPEANRNREMKMELAALYKNAGDLKNSLALYKSVLDAVPEKERLKDRKLIEEVAKAYKDAGDVRTALALYKGLWEAIPEKERGKDAGFGREFADFCEKAGDIRSALLAYKAVWDAIPEKERGKDLGMGEKLADLCEKAGDLRSALIILQTCYDAMSDGDKKDTKKVRKLQMKIQSVKSQLGIRGGA